MANQALSVHSTRKNLTKAERAARQEAESLVVTNATKPKMNDTTRSSKEIRKVFNQLKKYNEYYTEADSIALNTLAFNLYMKVKHEQALKELDILDDDYERFMIRLDKFNKHINESMKQLAIPLNARLSLANDLAKVMIEEKKLEAMEGPQVQEVNPLLAVLEATNKMVPSN